MWVLRGRAGGKGPDLRRAEISLHHVPVGGNLVRAVGALAAAGGSGEEEGLDQLGIG